MPTALLPNGQTTYVQSSLELSVSFPDAKTTASIEREIRAGLAGDPRQLMVRVQGGGGYGPWCFWIQWGQGQNCRRTSPTVLAESERTPEGVLARIQEELVKLRQEGEQAVGTTAAAG